MFSLIKSVLKSLELFLSLKNKKFYYDLHKGKLAIAMMMIGLTSCASVSTQSVSDLNIYQPSTLRLSKSIPVQTRDGIYTPQTDEVWHSDARYRRLEREIYSK